MEAGEKLVDLFLLAGIACGITRFQHDSLVCALARRDYARGQPARRGIVPARPLGDQFHRRQ